MHRCCTTRQMSCNKTTDSLCVQMYFSPSCTRACKARVRFSERSFSPGYGYDSCTIFATVLPPTERPGHELCATSTLYTIKITVHIKFAFDVSIFRSVHCFLTPPNTFPLISVIAFYTHGILRSPSFICGGGCRVWVHLNIASHLAISLVFMCCAKMAFF